MKPHVAANLQEELTRRSLPSDYDHLRFERSRGSATTFLHAPTGSNPVEQIGKGMFATAYRERIPPGRVFSVTDDDVYDKEILTMVEGPHVPKVERFGATVDDRKVYVMPFYKSPLRARENPDAWYDYKTLMECAEVAHVKQTHRPHESGYDQNVETIECGRSADVTDSVLTDLGALALMAANYDADAYFFDFHPKNLATDALGNLILLDVLFDKKKAMKIHRERDRVRAAR